MLLHYFTCYNATCYNAMKIVLNALPVVGNEFPYQVSRLPATVTRFFHCMVHTWRVRRSLLTDKQLRPSISV